MDPFDPEPTAGRRGWITVLLDEPVPTDPRARDAWARALGLDALGIGLRHGAGLAFAAGGRTIAATCGAAALPRAGLDLRAVPPGFDVGRGFVSLALDLPEREARLGQRCGPAHPHPFAAGGALRSLSRLAAALALRGPGVVLPRAGQLVLDRDTFVERLGDLDDPTRMPWNAWIGFSIDRRSHAYSSLGMAVFALPEVTVTTEAGNDWSLRRGIEALGRACATMVRENRALAVGETLLVPLGESQSAAPPRPATGACARYRVESADARGLRLVRVAPAIDNPVAWLAEAGSGPLAPNLYEALFEHAFARAFAGEPLGVFPATAPATGPATELTMEPATGPGAPPHALLLRQATDAAAGVWVTTSGFGRLVQPGGARSGVAHVELMSALPRPRLDVAALLALVGSVAFARGAEAPPLRVFDRLEAPLAELDLAGFVVDDGGRLRLGPGREVQLLALVPVTAAEYAEAQRLGSERWLVRALGAADRLPRIAARWKLRPE